MAVNQRELLSALVDGQLTGKELEQALLLVSTDPVARQDYLRYQQASDFIHGYTRGAVNTPIDLTQRISLALEQEPAHQQPSSQKAKILQFPSRVWRQAGGFAVAASAGALAVIGVMNQSIFQSEIPQTVATLQAPAAEERVASTTQVATTTQPQTTGSQVNRWTVGVPEVEDRLNHYLVDHSEYASGTSMFSYGRVVSYGTEQ